MLLGMRTETLLLSDARKRLTEIEDESVDLILTDPPYNTGITARASATRLHHFFDDALPAEEYRALAMTVAAECYRILKDDRAAYVFINWRSLGVWLDALTHAGFRLKNVIVWDKVLSGLNYQNYAHTHEFLIFAVKGRFFPRNKSEQGDGRTDLWHIRRETRQRSREEFHHETVKPVSLIARPIEHATLPGETVCDPFMGSGTTCVAAKILGRGYIGIELDPRFFSLAAKRIASVREGATLTTDGCRSSHRPRPETRTLRRSPHAKREER
jgi:site-specific DNA-methyltransferase (adenine-specific)